MIPEIRVQNLRDEMWKYHELIEEFDKNYRQDSNFVGREQAEKLIDEECGKMAQRVADLTKEYFEDMRRAGIYIQDITYDYDRKENSVYFKTASMCAAKIFKMD